MAKNFVMNRRTLLMGSLAAGSVGLLAACGGGSSSGSSGAASASALGVGEDIAKLVSVNPKEKSDLKEGGVLNLPVGSLGPDFNTNSQNGNSADTALVISTVSAISTTGLWQSDFAGVSTVNKDFCESFESSLEDGVQIHRIKLNPKAKFNDGTAIDIKALQATANVFKSADNGYNIVNSGAYAYVKSVEADGDDFTVKVTMETPYYPSDSLFGAVLHPALEDREIFKDGFVDNPRPEYMAGMFKVDNWNSAEKTFTVVPNENWWGEKPILERITFKQMEPAAARAAFKNGEIDATGARTQAAYKDVDGTAGSEMRRGQRLFSGGLNVNPARVTDQALRLAIFAAADRKALADIRFAGLNWSEELPGSMLLMPFSAEYRDNFSKAIEGKTPATILEGAGYEKSGDYYAKDGANAKVAITNFGDDPSGAALSQTFVQQMKAAGIECTIDQQPDANFAKVVGNKEYDVTFSGYTVGPEGITATSQYYLSSNNDGIGNAEIDKMIGEMMLIEDDKERAAKCNEIELKHMQEVTTLGTVFNGPDIYACKTGLANYGAALFGSTRLDPTSWAKVGWVKE